MTQADDRKYVELMSECLRRVLADLSNDAPQSEFHQLLLNIESYAKLPNADFHALRQHLKDLVDKLKAADDGKGGMIYKQRLCDKLAETFPDAAV
jgi:hypothetical protein